MHFFNEYRAWKIEVVSERQEIKKIWFKIAVKTGNITINKHIQEKDTKNRTYIPFSTQCSAWRIEVVSDWQEFKKKMLKISLIRKNIILN